MFQIIATIFLVLTLILISLWIGYKLSRLVYGEENPDVKKEYGSSESLEILKLEFDYAKSTSIQAQQDRLTLVNFYIGLFTLVVSVTIGIFENISDTYSKGISITFFILSVIGYLFVLQMVRLRQAWIDSAKVMNRIKDYFTDRDENLLEYIIWKTNTIPKPHKFKTINYFSSIIITLLGTGSLVAGLIVLEVFWIQIALLSSLYSIVCIASYHFMLQYNK
jgi:hypothetical protein